MLKKLTLTLLIAGTGFLTSRAETVDVDGIMYEVDYFNQKAKVTYRSYYENSNYQDDYYFYHNVDIPETIYYNGYDFTVTSIGDYAFRGAYLPSITLPNTITEIGNGSFEYCRGLQSITLPDSITSIGNKCFGHCEELQEITLSNKLDYIGDCCFEYSTSLGEVILPESCEYLPNSAFANCSSSLVVKMTNVWRLGYYCFEGTTGATIVLNSTNLPSLEYKCFGEWNNIIFSDKITDEIKDKIFSRIKYSESLCNIWTESDFSLVPEHTDTAKTEYTIITSALPYNLPNIQKKLILDNGFGVLSYVEKLKVIGSVNINDLYVARVLPNLTHLDLSEATIEGDKALTSYFFRNCLKLESIILPNGITIIGSFAFLECKELKSVMGLDCVETIESRAFYGCPKLETVGDMPTLTTIGESAFSGCSSLQTIGDMSSLTTIGVSAFSGCSSLQTIGDMSSLTTIGVSAFNGCKGLQTIGETPFLTSIESNAFKDCGLSDIYLPATISNVAVNAFTSPTIVHFAGEIPPEFDGTTISTFIQVPVEGLEAYRAALPTTLVSNILVDGPTEYNVTVAARQSDSDVLNKVNEGAKTDMAFNVFNLKVNGTINSYDIIVLRNKMLNLRKLDLSEATITASSYEYYTGCHTEDNVIGDNMFCDLKLEEIILPKTIQSIGKYAFNSCKNLRSIEFPASINSIGSSAFEGCSGLTTVIFPQKLESDNATIEEQAFKSCTSLSSVTLPQGLTTIGGRYSYNGAFYGCKALKSVVLPPSLVSIPAGCFYGCSSLETISVPPTLKSIGEQAFDGCSALTEFRIPAGVNSIGNGAIPGTVKDVYTYTIQPTSIGQETFASDTYLTATLHVPETSESLYYWDTQWSQFQSIENFNEPYTYFYLQDKDLIEDPDTPRIEGETDEETGEKKNPDANLGKDSGLIVEGNDSQDLGNVDLEHDGKDTGTSIIGGNSSTSGSGANVNIDLLNIQIPIEANKWYFFAFPFDIQCSNIKFNGQFVWRYYDGELRAMEGSGAWKNLKDSKLERGRGYIFQGSKKGTLTLSVPDAHIDGNNWVQELKQYMSEYAQDASWNFIGNPFQSFYELADLGFDSPITWWNPNTRSYEALSPLDDDMTMYPFMAFFVQKPEGVDDVEFWSQYRETKNQKDDPNYRAAARKRRAARRAKLASNPRKLINLTVTDGSGSDRTRVVFNEQASAAYEVGVDASKFVSAEAPQLYSLDADQVRYAINERPTGDGVVRLGFYAPASGAFTIECTRTDCETTLKDCQTGRTIALSAGATYEFTADKGYDDTRFVLNAKSGEETSIEEVKEPAKATYYRINGVETDGSHKGLMIEVKGNEASKIIGK